jgi:hypothetical protein
VSASVLSLSRLRSTLAQRWLIVVFGVVYLVSQVTILVIVSPLGSELGRLQVSAFTADATVAIFRGWESAGLMDVYRSHFVLDDVHWVWYASLLTVVLCTLFERRRVPHRFDWVLVVPLLAGLCDAYENHLQHVFLASPDHAAIVDPLPLFSTVASLTKWTLAGGCVLLAVGLGLRGRSRAG